MDGVIVVNWYIDIQTNSIEFIRCIRDYALYLNKKSDNFLFFNTEKRIK